MSWICLAEFPASDKLASLDQALRRQGVIHRITEEGGAQRVWVHIASAESAATLIAEFQDNPTKFEVNVSAAVQVTIEPNSNGLDASKSTPRLTTFLAQSPFTLLLIILGFLGFLAVQLPLKALYESMSFLPTVITGGWIGAYEWRWQEPWRLLTPIFLHFSFAHFAFNAAALLQMGTVVERHWGIATYALLCLVAGVFGNIAEGFVAGSPYFGGLSGVAYGIFAFNGWLQWRCTEYAFILPKGFYLFLSIFLVLGFTPVFEHVFGVSIANAAHLGGVIGGFCIAEALLRLDRSPKRKYILVKPQA